jgi:hypothetical protein
MVVEVEVGGRGEEKVGCRRLEPPGRIGIDPIVLMGKGQRGETLAPSRGRPESSLFTMGLMRKKSLISEWGLGGGVGDE